MGDKKVRGTGAKVRGKPRGRMEGRGCWLPGYVTFKDAQ